MNELETEFQELRTNTLQRVQEDYNQALGREQKAQGLVGQTKNEVDHLNGAAFQYAQLKSSAENYKKLYQDLDRVTREEDINRTFQDSVIQIEESGRPAAKQSFPLMWLDLILAFLLFGLTGIAVIILHDTLNTKLRKRRGCLFQAFLRWISLQRSRRPSGLFNSAAQPERETWSARCRRASEPRC